MPSSRIEYVGEYRRKVDADLIKLRVAKETLREHLRTLKKSKRQHRHSLEAQKVCQIVAKATQQQAHAKIAQVVTRCLKAVFDDPYEFQIKFEQKRGRTSASLVFVRNGREFVPMAASGGGVVDVASFALRVACLLMAKPAPRRTLFLDEPFKFLSASYRPRVATLLETLAEELDIQIIMVTHFPEFSKIGKTIEL